MNKEEFNKRMINAMEKQNLTENAKDILFNLLHQEILWDMINEFAEIKRKKWIMVDGELAHSEDRFVKPEDCH